MRYLLLLVLLTSCGRFHEVYIPNDNEAIKKQYDAINLIQDQKLSNLELRVKALEDGNTSLVEELTDMNEYLDALKDSIEDNTQRDLAYEVDIVRICNSKEHLVKFKSSFYAVYMVSNNYGTYYGKLDNNVIYTTTDGYNTRFKVNGINITCL